MKPIVLLCGASASGKTTLAEDLEKQCGLKAIPSYTTRPKRSPDEQGHTFITEDEFVKLNDLIAYAKTNGYHYTVTRQMFEDEQYSIYVVDNSGIKYLMDNYRGHRKWYVAYITAPLMQRFNRMMARQNDIEFAVERIEHDAVEFQRVPWDIQIENADGKYSEAFAALYLFCKHEGVIE